MADGMLDVVIIGAGLSGIGAARYLKRRLPGKSFLILESKPRMGGTWDLFRYPGIRSDSDMHTMGYAFKPWKHPKAISEGSSIVSYIKETATENDIDRHIRYEQKVVSASWSSAQSHWTLEIQQADGSIGRLSCSFIFSCAGYYNHHEGYLPEWAGYHDYKGTLVHPQFWPENLDYAGKRVVIVGSGATAVTLSPALAEKAAHVTQLQRSPTYVVSRPSEDAFNTVLKMFLPAQLAYSATRWRTIIAGRLRAKRMAKDPKAVKKMLVDMAAAEAGPDCDPRHFTPDYWPGQQRICRVPDGDMFKSIRDKKVSIVTDQIDRFDATGIQLKSGGRLDADIIITATGLVLQSLGGVKYFVDGQAIAPGKLLMFKGFMYSNMPNLIYFTGYFNASWTLKVDLVADYACRLLKYMDETGAKQVTPVADNETFAKPGRPNRFLSGYIKRAAGRVPKMGADFPWFTEQNYFWDRKTLLRGKVDDGTLDFSGPKPITLPPLQRADEVQQQAAE
ncbi:MAG: NAD(P)/FAD-dependent oxidoreductase [Hyphomicrobiales bacterium]|nr:MAG: NAD(P)/FAD-dependent oxidoreductase [Hyphomicrobiales bacterium]